MPRDLRLWTLLGSAPSVRHAPMISDQFIAISNGSAGALDHRGFRKSPSPCVSGAMAVRAKRDLTPVPPQ